MSSGYHVGVPTIAKDVLALAHDFGGCEAALHVLGAPTTDAEVLALAVSLESEPAVRFARKFSGRKVYFYVANYLREVECPVCEYGRFRTYDDIPF